MNVQDIPMKSIVVSEFNTRKDLDSGTEDAGLDDLANSIKQRGLLNPILIRTASDGKFEIIAGQRRFLAFKKLGLPAIPAVVNDGLDDADATVVSLVENVHRAEMHPIDKARAYKRIYDVCGTYSEVAKQANVNPSTVSKYIKLLDLSSNIQDDLMTLDGPIGVAALSTLAQLFSIEDQQEARDLIVGFNQGIQIQIMRESGGNLEKLSELREQWLSGAFDVQWCGEGLCFQMSEKLKAEVIRLIAEAS